MQRRSYWKGHVRLSLVTFPVQLFPAIDSEEKLTLHQLHRPSGERIRHQKVVPDLGPVDKDEIAKGFEYEPGRYVVIEQEELDALRLESTHTIELVQFCPADTIDAVYYERPYYVVPEAGVGEAAFRVVRDALRAARKVAVGQVVLAGRERIAALRPCGRGMVLETLRYGEELHEVEGYFEGIGDASPSKEQVGLARELILAKSAPFHPERFHDHYRNALRELVRAKLAGRRAPEPRTAAERENILDLAEALRRSLAGTDGSGAKGKPPSRRKPRAA